MTFVTIKQPTLLFFMPDIVDSLEDLEIDNSGVSESPKKGRVKNGK